MGANVGATRANSFPRQVDEYGQATGDHARSRTGLDDAERLTGIYQSEGLGFESSERAYSSTPVHRPFPGRRERAFGIQRGILRGGGLGPVLLGGTKSRGECETRALGLTPAPAHTDRRWPGPTDRRGGSAAWSRR